MLNMINFIILVIAGILMSILYVISVSPQKMEKRWGDKAYKRCSVIRAWSMVFLFIVVINYVIYTFYPLNIGLINRFPWPYWVSLISAVILLVPSIYLMGMGMKDAGEEAVRPDKSHTMYGGIYEKIRHPQAFGELILWFAIAIACHSIHLTILSLIWIPVWIWWCVVEENDLILRYGDPYKEYQKRTGMFLPRKSKRSR